VASLRSDRLPCVLDRAAQKKIIKLTRGLWDKKCTDGAIVAYMERKERGHGLADWVEDVTVEMLEEELDGRVAYEHRNGERRKRSIGDLWIECGGIYNPVNIKTGVKEPGKRSTGQPNLVALNKLTKAVAQRWIDSYYLLFIHFVTTRPETVEVALADLLHIAEDYAHFDSGTGQFMLKAGKYDEPPPPIYSAVDPDVALAHLRHVREDGNRRLFAKREVDLEKMLEEIADFDSGRPIHQEALSLEEAR
jgi:hypothetical protein